MKSKLITLLLAILFGANIVLARDYVVFVSQQDGSSVGLAKLSTHQILEYSEDTITWTNMATETTIPLDAGDSIFVRGILSDNNTYLDHTKFAISGNIKVSGNANTIWNYDAQDLEGGFLLPNNCGFCLFQECQGLTDASKLKLPATILSHECYAYMFNICSSLIAAPELPATTLAEGCYICMFQGCVISKAPMLPALTLAADCYLQMFDGCQELLEAPELPATTIAEGCYDSMFSGCTKLETAPSILPATTLKEGCYNLMFEMCAIKTAPELPATQLVGGCYEGMFQECSNLNNIKCLAIDISANNCLRNWVSGVASSGTFVKANSMDDWAEGDSGIPSGWTVDTQCLISSGTCGANGDNLTWELSCDSILTISGTGDMANSPTWRADSLAIKEVIIHEGVTSIGNSAFHRCRNLISVTIPNSVASIGSGAFSRSGVVSMTIPSGVTTIGSLAFNNCNSLEVISISNTVTEIREQAFHRCQNLSNIHVDLDNLNYSSVDGILFNKNQTKLIKYPDAKQGEYTIPNSVTEIDIFAFAMCIDLTAVHIPETIDTIRNHAFFECASLASMRCDAITPPVLDYSVFFHVDCPNIPLYVPVASIDLYKAADQWKEFQILPIERKFQISWVNYDETILKVDSVYESYMPGFIGDTPTKPATAKYTYTFKGWDPEITAVTGNATYTAQFDSVVNSYTIAFNNCNGAELQSSSVAYGQTPEYNGSTPTKPATEKYTYTFKGWEPELAAVTGNATYTAQFDSTLIEYEIDTNPGSEPIEGGSVHVNGTPNYGETITLTPIEEDGYVFVEWSDGNNDNPREIVVEGDIAIYPIFHKCEEIIFNIAHTIYKGSSYSFGGKELTVKGLYYDTIPLANGCDSVVELKLSVVKAPNFTLRLVVNNETMGTVTGTGSYKAGTSVTVTATPASSKYIFVRWYNEDVNIDVYENPYTFTLNRNLQLRAVFRRASRKAPKSTSQTK